MFAKRSHELFLVSHDGLNDSFLLVMITSGTLPDEPRWSNWLRLHNELFPYVGMMGNPSYCPVNPLCWLRWPENLPCSPKQHPLPELSLLAEMIQWTLCQPDSPGGPFLWRRCPLGLLSSHLTTRKAWGLKHPPLPSPPVAPLPSTHHDIGQRCIAGLIEPQVSGHHSRQLQAQSLQASINLPLHFDLVPFQCHLGGECALGRDSVGEHRGG